MRLSYVEENNLMIAIQQIVLPYIKARGDTERMRELVLNAIDEIYEENFFLPKMRTILMTEIIIKDIPLPTFDEIGETKLRAWNRLNIIFNLKETVNNAASTRYASQFTKEDKFAIFALALYVTKNGYENTRREVFKEFVNV